MAGLVSARVRYLLFAVGAGFLVFIVWQAGPRAVAERLGAMGPRWPLVLVPSALAMLVDTLAWRYGFSPGVEVRFLALLRARLAGEAVNTLTPAAYVGGEPVKVYLLAPVVPVSEGVSSVIIARTFMTLAQVVFVVAGIVVALGRFRGDDLFLAASVGLVVAATAGMGWLVFRQQRGLVGWLTRVAARLGVRPKWVTERADAIAELDVRIAALYREERRRLQRCFAWFLAGWVAGVGETYIALRLMGLPVDLPTAFSLEALAGMAKAATFVIPGSLGGQEGAHALLFAGFGYPLAAAVGYSVVRRARELLWAGVGLGILARAGHPERRVAAP